MYQYDDYDRDPFMEPEGPPDWLGLLVLLFIVAMIVIGVHQIFN